MDDIELYQYPAGREALYNKISELVTFTSKGVQMIKDNSNEFIKMVVTRQGTKASAEKILKNTNELLNKLDDSLTESKNFNSNFEKVLANTRSQNSNKNQLFSFFAQPLSIKKSNDCHYFYGKSMNWRWPLVLIIEVLLGLLVSIFSKILSNKKELR